MPLEGVATRTTFGFYFPLMTLKQMTTEQLLQEIKTIAARKQMFGNKGISIDTLLLALRISEADLMPLITELQDQGFVEFHPAASGISRRSQLLGTIHLPEVQES